MSTLRSLQGTSVEVPAAYSREKAIMFAKGKGTPVPETKATDMLYILFMKIGAIKELPSNERMKESYLNDFWLDLYYNNHLCPGDIPFHIVIKSFTTSMVQGVIDRKGNNQAAICQAFNRWVVRSDVRNRLYQLRDEMYPEGKPKQITEQATQESITDYSDEELLEKIEQIKPMAGIKMADEMIKRLEKENKRRINKLEGKDSESN